MKLTGLLPTGRQTPGVGRTERGRWTTLPSAASERAPFRASALIVSWIAASIGFATPALAQPGSPPADGADPAEVARFSTPPVAAAEVAETPPEDARVDADLQVWPWLVATPLLTAALLVELLHAPTEPLFVDTGPIDESFEPLVIDTSRGRLRAARASDALLVATLAMPVLDAAVHAREGASRSRDAYRLLAGDALAFGIQASLVTISKSALRRERPYNHRCDGTVDFDDCGSRSRYRGFVSGHTAASFTAASLVCAHQRLRGRSPLGTVECVVSLALASTVGALRITSEKHYFGDVLGGALVGFLSGFVVPLVIYPRALPAPREPAPSSAAIEPRPRAF